MKPRYLILIATLVLMSGCLQLDTPPAESTTTSLKSGAPSDGFLTYENPNQGIKMDYPADWDRQEQISGLLVAFLSPSTDLLDTFRDNLIVLTQDLSAQPLILDDYTAFSLAELEKLTVDFTLIESRETLLAGNPAHKIVFTGKTQDQTIKILQIWTIKNNKVYLLSYTSTPEKYSTFFTPVKRMIESFEIAELTAVPAAAFLTYESSLHKIKIKYPANWEIQEQIEGATVVAFISPSGSIAGIGVQDFLAQPMTLEEYTPLAIEQLRQTITGLDIIGSRQTSLAGNPAHKIVYTWLSPQNNPVKTLQILAIKNNTLYVFIFTAEADEYSRLLDTVQEMIDSFEIS